MIDHCVYSINIIVVIIYFRRINRRTKLSYNENAPRRGRENFPTISLRRCLRPVIIIIIIMIISLIIRTYRYIIYYIIKLSFATTRLYFFYLFKIFICNLHYFIQQKNVIGTEKFGVNYLKTKLSIYRKFFYFIFIKISQTLRYRRNFVILVIFHTLHCFNHLKCLSGQFLLRCRIIIWSGMLVEDIFLIREFGRFLSLL